MNQQPLPQSRRRAFRLLTGLFVFSLLVLCACRASEEAGQSQGQTPSHITIDGVAVPVFAGAEEQLNYTRAWFADPAEKRAALLAFQRLFPERKRYRGLAALDLAYLELGDDYRLAPEHDGFAAIRAYKQVIADYGDYPQIQAKAHWYIGWIYTDVLGEAEKGVDYFQQVVNRYPDEEVGLLSPAPWVSIIYPGETTPGTRRPEAARNTWASLALVEIIRHADDDELAWSAFVRLWEAYRQSVAAGFGLKLILERRIHVAETLVIAREYMEKYSSNVHILSDIQKLITGMRRGGEA